MYYYPTTYQMPIYFVEDLNSGLIKIESNAYQNIYVSLGGKFNEPLVCYNDIKMKANSEYQMIPGYLRNTAEKSLVIIIDVFLDPLNRDTNTKLLDSVIKDSPNIDVILLNNEITSKSLKTILRTILMFAKSKNIHSSKYLFCNYIRFISPNQMETILEMKLPSKIQRVHNEFPEYSNGFYQWYGQRIQTYNLIYNFKKYHYGWLSQHSRLSLLFQKYYEKTQLNMGNTCLLMMQAEKVVESFLHNSFDITWTTFYHL
jgi:hypothetical protein